MIEVKYVLKIYEVQKMVDNLKDERKNNFCISFRYYKTG